MATITAFDKINKLGASRPTYTEYFGEMPISAAQKRKRVDLADIIEDEILFFFAIYLMGIQYGVAVDHKSAERQYRKSLSESLRNAGIREQVIKDYLEDVVSEEAKTTRGRYMEDDYWTSYDRAITIAENDANTIMNAQEYNDAVESGKRKKQWLTMRDELVRPTHQVVDSASIPIDEPFVVGDSLMMFPRDSSMGADASEIVNCRCSVEYS